MHRNTPASLVLIAAVVVSALLPVPARAGSDRLDPAVPSPESVLGYSIGDYHSDYRSVVRYAEALAAAAPERAQLIPIGESNERRPMLLLVVSSPENMARLDAIRTDVARLADPRGLSADEAETIIARTPAISWSNFGNDGNESAAVEAALELGYLLSASRDGAVAKALEQVVVVLNICHNPESRERFVAWYNAHQVGPKGTADPQALEHTGPWGMDTNNNHYQTDLNRDSVFATQIETRNVIAAYNSWNPQTFIDHHGETENFFFPPVTLPVNPNVSAAQLKWMEDYGRAIAAACDERGWSYFHGERFDEFYPGYWDAYPLLRGAIGFTFETNAGGYTGLRVERDDETVITLRDGVDKHVVGALAVIGLTAERRADKLRDFYRYHKTAIEEGAAGPVRAYAVLPGSDPGRAASLVDTLQVHGIEVWRTNAGRSVDRARAYGSGTTRPATLPADTYLVPLDQPEKRMIQALMESDPQQQQAFLEKEAEKRAFNRQRGKNVPARRHGFYDITAWALPLSFDVEAFALESPVAADVKLEAAPWPVASVPDAPPRTAYLFDPRPLGATRLALALLGEGFKLAVAREAFRLDGRDWPAGTFVVRVERNESALHERLPVLAGETGIDVAAAQTAWTESGIDLGSADVDSLKPPRIALVGDAPTRETSFGAVWFLLERRLGHEFTVLRAAALADADLSRYDVLVLPDGSAGAWKRVLDQATRERLRRFVEDGGVLVAIAGAAEFAADEEVGWSEARLLGPVSPKEDAAAKAEGEEKAPGAGEAAPGVLETERALAKQRERREQETDYVPGAVFAADLESRHPFAFGHAADSLPVLVRSSRVFAASPSGTNVARLRREDPRLAGFAWPESIERLRGAAWLIDEPHGKGRVVLFAEDPVFRNFWRGTEKLFTNALLLGPSLR